jgi:hypothetical protein
VLRSRSRRHRHRIWRGEMIRPRRAPPVRHCQSGHFVSTLTILVNGSWDGGGFGFRLAWTAGVWVASVFVTARQPALGFGSNDSVLCVRTKFCRSKAPPPTGVRSSRSSLFLILDHHQLTRNRAADSTGSSEITEVHHRATENCTSLRNR